MSVIPPLIAQGCFEPETTKLMGEVFDELIRSLDRFGRPPIVQEAVARRIIEVVGDGERDPDVIYQRVLAAMASQLGLAEASQEVANRPS